MADGDFRNKHRLSLRAKPVINGRFLSKPIGGVPRVGMELLRALSDELSATNAEWKPRIATPRSVDLQKLGVEGAGRRSLGFAGRLGEQLGLPVLYPGATVISFCNATPMLAYRSVVWIHDAHVFDAPETYPLAYRLWHRAIMAAVKARRFDVVTVSEFSRQRLAHYGVRPERLHVIYNGGDHILRVSEDPAILDKVGLGTSKYVLLVGSPARHKNVPFALNALLAARGDYRVAVLGLAQSGPYRDAGALAGDPRIVYLPRLTESELRTLYRRSSAVISPSLCEGFGLYAAEAMFADAGPLVLSDRGALPEVGGDAAIYFDPTRADQLCAAVSCALQPAAAQRYREAARIQREKFRWRRAARQLIDQYLS